MSPKGSFASAGPSEQFAFGGGSAIISLAFTFNDSTDLGTFAKRLDLNSDFSPIMNLLRQSLRIAAMRTLDGRDDK